MCEELYWGEVSFYRDFQPSFNPKCYHNPLKSTPRSRTSAQCSLAFHSGVLFAKPLHSKSAYLCSLLWQPLTAGILRGPEYMFLNSEYPKLKSNLKAKSSSVEVWLAVWFHFCFC